MKITKKDGSEAKARPLPPRTTGLGLLPPPPGGSRLPAPPGSSPAGSPSHTANKPADAGDSWSEFAAAKPK